MRAMGMKWNDEAEEKTGWGREKSATCRAKVGIRSEVCKMGHGVIQRYRSARGVGWLESK